MRQTPSHMQHRLTAAAAGIVLLLGFGCGAHAAESPRFEPTACDLPNVSAVLPRLRCGIVRVPRDYAKPDGASFALAVVVIASDQQPRRPDPVLYISGGPGAPLTIFSGFQAAHPYDADRDLILVDQRGTGRSEPRLCPGLGGAFLNAMLAVAATPDADTLAQNRAVHRACRDQILRAGLDPADFGTRITVADYERVRQALGIERWNVVGTSYGTTVAMTMMVEYPDSLRSVVLDSLNPPDAILVAPWSVRVAAARDAFLAACASAYPGLPDLYQQARRRLRDDRVFLALPAELHYPDNKVLLTPSLFEVVLGRLLYDPTNYPNLPRMIAAVSDGDVTAFTQYLGALLLGARDTLNSAAFTAVECRERPHWHRPMAEDTDVLDETLLVGVCADWSGLGPLPLVPGRTSVPTLVLAGQFDPNIPPTLSHEVAESMGENTRWIEFAGMGHSVRHYSPCAQHLVAAFIEKPNQALDTACAETAGASATSTRPTP